MLSCMLAALKEKAKGPGLGTCGAALAEVAPAVVGLVMGGPATGRLVMVEGTYAAEAVWALPCTGNIREKQAPWVVWFQGKKPNSWNEHRRAICPIWLDIQT